MLVNGNTSLPSRSLGVCVMAHGLVYNRWSCEKGTFKSDLEIERVIRTAFCYVGAGKVGGN